MAHWYAKKAKGCAWRAVYVGRILKSGMDVQLFHIGVDPNHGIRPTLFGAVLVGWFKTRARRIPRQFKFRVTLPYIPWWSGAGPLYLKAYRASSRFWFNVFKKEA